MTNLPFAATTPVSIARVGLMARDAGSVADFYKKVLGLRELARSGASVSLGTDDRELLYIEESAALKPDDPRSAGLYHTAFLLPRRVDLARWTQHAIDTRIAVDGASDHLVSEAVYLTDPEGNGVEIYVDRDRQEWQFDDASVRMATDPLDFQNLMGELDGGVTPWGDVPADTVVGHVHMRVGDVRAAEEWWKDQQGFETMLNYGGQAVFLATGGYHHHIGANSWQSRGAGPRPVDTTGLGFVELVSNTATGETESRDPWGTRIRVIPATA